VNFMSSEPKIDIGGDPASTFTPVEIIPLDRAVLCANCNCITASTNGHCVACGSRESLLNLARLLDNVQPGSIEPQVADATGEP
jgi:hypothetical protein